ncbi:MAG: hypothetical protein CL785_00150 [Chloroflexi bacterium]|nr:hypothetical protein [Chloroflexota bacterium]|tara:strand:- start:14067 stop:14351 length:285 start_codon:yes stop_codon:yes gene_type:complete
MCDFETVTKVNLDGSGQHFDDWFEVNQVQIYHDHFIKAQVEDGIVIDVFNENEKFNNRKIALCLELSSRSAKELANAILYTVESLEQKRKSNVK